MSDYRDEFITWYNNEFKETELFRDMASMVENSPWHRESNVGVHTDMVVSQYLSRAGAYWSVGDADDHQYLLGAFAAAFHDVGKPAAVEYKHSEARGDYKAFGGHEKASARLWEDWAMSNEMMLLTRFFIIHEDIYKVGWMIENHLPWGLKDKRKRASLAQTVLQNGISDDFSMLLISDTTGRISDDAETKYANSVKWLSDFFDLMESVKDNPVSNDSSEDKPQLVMPVAPSGAGKTTIFKAAYQDNGYAHFSLDEMRMSWAGALIGTYGMEADEIYSACWAYCAKHEKEFRAYWQAEYVNLVKRGVNIFIDACNLSRKSRRFFLSMAEHHGYYRTAWLLPTTLGTVKDRQGTRKDKEVPGHAVEQQYMSLSLPWYGEFDKIIVK